MEYSLKDLTLGNLIIFSHFFIQSCQSQPINNFIFHCLVNVDKLEMDQKQLYVYHNRYQNNLASKKDIKFTIPNNDSLPKEDND